MLSKLRGKKLAELEEEIIVKGHREGELPDFQAIWDAMEEGFQRWGGLRANRGNREGLMIAAAICLYRGIKMQNANPFTPEEEGKIQSFLEAMREFDRQKQAKKAAQNNRFSYSFKITQSNSQSAFFNDWSV